VEHDIQFILWEDVSYTFVGRIWPELANLEAFDVDGYRFEPLFHYDGWETQYGARPTTIWKVTRQ
jgi:hypothetical protein